MNIKLELISNAITELVIQKLDVINIDTDKIADTTAIKALSEIQTVIQNNNLSDFDAIENIVCIFEKYNIDAKLRHDFG